MNATPQADFSLRLPLILLIAILVAFGAAWFLKRRTRFRLSTILWIITLVAVVLGWIFDRRQLESRLREATLLEARIQALNAKLAAEQDRSNAYQALINKADAEKAPP
jgi:hypothetical protein